MVLLGLLPSLPALARRPFLRDGAGRSAFRPRRAGPSGTQARSVEPALPPRSDDLPGVIELARLCLAGRQPLSRCMGFGSYRSAELLLSGARWRPAVLCSPWPGPAAASADDAGADGLSAAAATLGVGLVTVALWIPQPARVGEHRTIVSCPAVAM